MAKVKLVDIAKKSGVSIASVSAALNNTAGVSAVKKKKILKIASDMGYQPSLAARLLKRNQVDDIALIINDYPEKIVSSATYQTMTALFVHECRREKLRYQIEYTNLDKDEIPSSVSGGLVGGALHMGVLEPALREWLHQNRDFVLVQVDEPYDYNVVLDANSGLQKSVEYLCAKGHRKIGLIHGPFEFYTHAIAHSSFLQLVDDYQLDILPEYIQGFDKGNDLDIVNGSYAAAEKMLSLKKPPTAVICMNISTARAAVYQASLHGKIVPRDLSVIAHGALPWEAEQSCPAFCSAEQDWETAITLAMNMIRRRIRGLLTEPQTETVEMRMVKRLSVCGVNPKISG